MNKTKLQGWSLDIVAAFCILVIQILLQQYILNISEHMEVVIATMVNGYIGQAIGFFVIFIASYFINRYGLKKAKINYITVSIIYILLEKLSRFIAVFRKNVVFGSHTKITNVLQAYPFNLKFILGQIILIIIAIVIVYMINGFQIKHTEKL